MNSVPVSADIPVIRAEGLGKRYGRRWALRECSFDIPPGRVVALVGAFPRLRPLDFERAGP